jgi:hypothetical protein
MEERIKELESKVDKLINVIKYLTDKLDSHLDSTSKVSKIEVPKRLVSNQDVKVTKDRVFLQSILERTTNPSSQKFLQSIINNTYDTLTVKQQQVVDDIVNQL